MLYLLELIFQSSSNTLLSFITYVFSILLLYHMGIILISFRLWKRKKHLLVFESLVAMRGSVLKTNLKPSSNPISRKRFLVFVPYITHNILLYSYDTGKISTINHLCHKEIINDLPNNLCLPNQHTLESVEQGEAYPCWIRKR